MILEGKTVIVCGVGGGLGSKVARLAIRDGANLVLAARTQGKLESVAKGLDPTGERVACVATDITDEEQCRNLASAAVDRFGGIDALVPVAAVDAVAGGLGQVTDDDWLRCFETNVIGTTRLVRAVAPHMKARGGGSIVLIGSQTSFAVIPPPGVVQLAYASSKGALRTASILMASELGRDKIRVNTVVPTWMWGPFVEEFLKATARRREVSVDDLIAEVESTMALGEIPKDDDVAEAVIFLASDRARAITGQYLMVNAGQLMP